MRDDHFKKEIARMIEGKRTAILAEEDFEDSELMEPLRAMKDADASVLIVGSGSKKNYRVNRSSAQVTEYTTADKVKASQFDAIIVFGGYAPDKMRYYQPMIDLVGKAYAEGKITAAVFHGPHLLISADMIRGRRVTSWPSVAADLKNAGDMWVGESTVRNDNTITSRKPADLPKFSKAIIDTLL